MFKVGEYIVYGCKGVCLIEEITHIDIPGSNKDRLYYVLAPYGDGKGKIYAPTDNEKVTMKSHHKVRSGAAHKRDAVHRRALGHR